MKYYPDISNAIAHRSIQNDPTFSQLGRGKWYHWRVEVLLQKENKGFAFVRLNFFQRVFCKLHLFGYHKRVSLKNLQKAIRPLRGNTNEKTQKLLDRLDQLWGKEVEPITPLSTSRPKSKSLLPKLNEEEEKQLQQWEKNYTHTINTIPQAAKLILSPPDWLHSTDLPEYQEYDCPEKSIYSLSYDHTEDYFENNPLHNDLITAALKKVRIFITHPKHFAYICCDIEKKEFLYYDSLPTHTTQKVKKEALQNCKEQLAKTLAIRGKLTEKTYDFSTFSTIIHDDFPRQENVYDCGVYALAASHCTAHDIPVTKNSFNAADIAAFRRYLAYQMLKYHGEL